MKTGVLLLNIGTPNACDLKSVKAYLRDFLSDPYVLDIPLVLRWLLVHALIVPFRSPKTLKAYQSIWQPLGSPLRVLSHALQKALKEALGFGYVVEIGMRYSAPTIEEAVQNLYFGQCEKIVLLPLFPQFAQATTTSSLKAAHLCLKKYWQKKQIVEISPFYGQINYIEALSLPLKKIMTQVDHILFSFHGLPERHLQKKIGKQHICEKLCKPNHDCPKIGPDNQLCYRAQCFQTAASVAKTVGLSREKYTVCFQSRLGRIPWIRPYTEVVLTNLAEKGVKNIAVLCPAFVIDCLETTEEIGIQAKAQWQALGGKAFILLPCLNDDPNWIQALCGMIQNQC